MITQKFTSEEIKGLGQNPSKYPLLRKGSYEEDFRFKNTSRLLSHLFSLSLVTSVIYALLVFGKRHLVTVSSSIASLYWWKDYLFLSQ